MKVGFKNFVAIAAMAMTATVYAGGDEPMHEAEYHAELLHQITMHEAEMLFDSGVPFFDVNTLEVWAKGYIPGATFFNRDNWRTLLPADKTAVMVFYCENRLCTQSEMAAREVMKLGYTNVLQMPDGIQGWIKSGNEVERP